MGLKDMAISVALVSHLRPNGKRSIWDSKHFREHTTLDQINQSTCVDNSHYTCAAFAASRSAIDRPNIIDARPIESSPPRIRSTTDFSNGCGRGGNDMSARGGRLSI